MRRFIIILLCLGFVNTIIMPLGTKAAVYTADSYITNHRSKAIHVVYDDSASMIRDGGVYHDRWGQAKYAMEVFAAMLEENDTMRVYYMSDFDTSVRGGNINAPPRVTMLGSESVVARVEKIHDTVTQAANTPFDAALKAYEDIKSETADEKWLVVLTDGEFNRLHGADASVDADSFYSQFVNESDVKIMHFAMGDIAATITPYTNRIFFEQSRNDNEILGEITHICNQIFNRNVLRFTNQDRYEFSFDIPMMELLVFAQGANVNINGISGDGTYGPNETVNVRYSEIAADNYRGDPNVIVSRNLVGIISSIQNIPKGDYRLDIMGAETVEIYYKPVVNLDIKLFQNDVEVRDDPVVEGEYQIYYGIVDETGEFFQSSLLGLVSYTAVAKNGGQEIHITNGETLRLVPNELLVDVKAQFLEINTAESVLSRKVDPEIPPPPPPTELVVEIAAPNYDFTRTNLNESGTFIITVKHEGNLLTDEQWRSMDLPSVTSRANVEIADIRRGSAVSTFEFNIKQRSNNPSQTAHGTITINAEAKLLCDFHGGYICEGSGSTRVSIKNDVSRWEEFKDFVDRNWDWLKWVLGALAALLLIFLLWGTKKRFPRYMAKDPKVYQTTGRSAPLEYDGRFRKALWSRICPFVAHRGTINVIGGYDHVLPHMEVRALGGHDMVLTNTRVFLQNALVDCEFYPDGITRTPRDFDGNIMVPCSSEVRTEFLRTGKRTVYRCHLRKSEE